MIEDKSLRASGAYHLEAVRFKKWLSADSTSLSTRNPTRVAAAAIILLLLGACSQPPPPVTSAPRTPAVCEALRPALPISYSSSRDTPETVKGVRQANARFSAACP